MIFITTKKSQIIIIKIITMTAAVATTIIQHNIKIKIIIPISIIIIKIIF